MKKKYWLFAATLLSFWSLAHSARAVTYQAYSMAPAGAHNATYYGQINNRGETVAYENLPNGTCRTFFYNPVTAEQADIGYTDWATQWWDVTAINDRRQIAGYLGGQPAMWDPVEGYTYLGHAGGGGLWLNDSGMAAGATMVLQPDGGYWSHAVYWTASHEMHDIGTLGGVSSAAVGINDAGQIAGGWEMLGGGSQAFFWSPDGGMQDLGTLGGFGAYATAINNQGQVCGVSWVDDDTQAVFLWDKDNGMRELFTLPYGQFVPRAMNDSGCIVGAVGQQGFLWDPREGLSFFKEGGLGDINNAGQITGYISGIGSVLWNPVPEPSSLLALAAGIGVLGAAIRRRRR
jgi:probable HAF family extracellular repeat protein